jgi:hypothetical protein
MSVKDIQSFISTDALLVAAGTCVNKVNLLKLHVPAVIDASRKQPRGRGMPLNGQMNPMIQSRTALVLDAEHCLDRLYGGCYPGILSIGHSISVVLVRTAIF